MNILEGKVGKKAKRKRVIGNERKKRAKKKRNKERKKKNE